jgi:hypothetical protein
MLRLSLILALATTLAGPILAQSNQAPSLADVARQTKNAKKAKVVVTEDNLPPRLAPVPAATSSAKDGGEQTLKQDQPDADGNAKNSNESENSKLQNRIDELKQSEAAERMIIAKCEDALKDGSLPYVRRETYEEWLSDAKEELANLKAQREAVEKTLRGQQGSQDTAPPAKEQQTTTPE